MIAVVMALAVSCTSTKQSHLSTADRLMRVAAGLRDPSSRKKRTTAKKLGKLGAAAKPALGELKTALYDQHWDVARHAALAIVAICPEEWPVCMEAMVKCYDTRCDKLQIVWTMRKIDDLVRRDFPLVQHPELVGHEQIGLSVKLRPPIDRDFARSLGLSGFAAFELEVENKSDESALELQDAVLVDPCGETHMRLPPETVEESLKRDYPGAFEWVLLPPVAAISLTKTLRKNRDNARSIEEGSVSLEEIEKGGGQTGLLIFKTIPALGQRPRGWKLRVSLLTHADRTVETFETDFLGPFRSVGKEELPKLDDDPSSQVDFASITAAIESLGNLRAKGLISESEYEEKRTVLLNKIK